jgi:hypothetical protein
MSRHPIVMAASRTLDIQGNDDADKATELSDILILATVQSMNSVTATQMSPKEV